MAYPFGQPENLTQEQSDDLRMALDYQVMTSMGAWKDLMAFIDSAVQASQDTLYKDQTQRPLVGFGLLKRWQERKALRDLIESRVTRFIQLAEEIKEQSNEHNPGDPGSDNQ